jgi:L-amino acid N-acyltransferase YncA
MIVRKANINDAAGIAEVHVKSWKSSYEGIIDEQYLKSLKIDDRIPLWVSSLSDPKDEAPVFVALNEEGGIIGFASFGRERENNGETEGELYAIYLLKEAKGKGVGTLLFYNGVQELIKHGNQSVRVWVLAQNPSTKFYEKFNPRKDSVTTIKIGNNNYEEIAYQWDNIQELVIELQNHLKI